MDFNVIELLEFCLTDRLFLKNRLTDDEISRFIISLKNEKKRRRIENIKLGFCILMGYKP